MTVCPLWDTRRDNSDSLGAYKTSRTVIGSSPDGAGVRVQVLRDHYCPHRECWVMEWEIQVKWNDLGATSGTGLDSSHSEGLMLDLGPQAAAITAIKSPSSDKVSCKSNPILGRAHMLAVIQLHINNLMVSLYFLSSYSTSPLVCENWFLKENKRFIYSRANKHRNLN